MTDIRFYHLQKQNLDQALPLILEKAYSAGYKSVVRMESTSEIKRMSKHLWVYKQQAFLPHGSKKDGLAEDQPIWITDQNENPNSANTLILTQGQIAEDIESYDLCCEMLDGHSEEQISSARSRWKEYQEAGHEVTYWHQNENGGWEKKA